MRTWAIARDLVTPCPVCGKHSCSPSQGMSMLVPDFAAVRYFYNYRFPHVRLVARVCRRSKARKCKTGAHDSGRETMLQRGPVGRNVTMGDDDAVSFDARFVRGPSRSQVRCIAHRCASFIVLRAGRLHSRSRSFGQPDQRRHASGLVIAPIRIEMLAFCHRTTITARDLRDAETLQPHARECGKIGEIFTRR